MERLREIFTGALGVIATLIFWGCVAGWGYSYWQGQQQEKQNQIIAAQREAANVERASQRDASVAKFRQLTEESRTLGAIRDTRGVVCQKLDADEKTFEQTYSPIGDLLEPHDSPDPDTSNLVSSIDDNVTNFRADLAACFKAEGSVADFYEREFGGNSVAGIRQDIVIANTDFSEFLSRVTNLAALVVDAYNQMKNNQTPANLNELLLKVKHMSDGLDDLSPAMTRIDNQEASLNKRFLDEYASARSRVENTRDGSATPAPLHAKFLLN